MAIKKLKQLIATEKNNSATRKSLDSLGFQLTTVFKGYRNKEDITNLPSGYLVSPSQNVIVNTAGLVQTRNGFTLDGQAGTSGKGILGSFDFIRGSYGDQHLRSANTKVQYRYVASGGDSYKGMVFTQGQVYWIDLATTSSDYVNFCTFFDYASEKLNFLLWVQMDTSITEWSGGVTTILSSTSNTITKTGTQTWAQAGFYTAKSPRTVVVNGNSYTYTGGETSTTLTGVSGDPTGEAIGSVVHQLPISATVTPTAGVTNDLIGNLGNQIYLASYASNVVNISKINDYKTYTQSSPRKPGDGYTATVDGLVRAIRTQESTMYVGWGNSGWTTLIFTLSSDLTSEAVTITPVKTAPLQGPLSDGLVCNIGNDLAFITNEPTLTTLGLVENIHSSTTGSIQLTNMSDPVKNDMDSYGTSGFADGQTIYHKFFIYVSIPKKGIVQRYNLAMGWWEPPWILDVARFSVIDGSLFGHSYQTDQTYQLNNGTNDNGNPMHSMAAFSYDNFEDRITKKNFNEWMVEGYIAANTYLNAIRKFDFGGFNGLINNIVGGDNSVDNLKMKDSQNIIFQTTADGSLGKNPLGTQPIGSITDSLLQLPKFRVILTGIPTNFYEYQPYFETNDIDQQWALLAFGPRVQKSVNESNEVKI